MAHVPYRNSPQSIADVAAGHVTASVAEAGASLPLIKDKKLTALAVTGTMTPFSHPLLSRRLDELQTPQFPPDCGGNRIVMASRGRQTEPRPAPRLYLVTPRDSWLPADVLAQALAAGDFAAVLLRLPDGDERRQVDHIRSLAGAVQDHGAALLLDGHPRLAARTGADGAHLDGVENLQAALSTLKPDRIAGCGGLASRHDAMAAGEAGADYVMFGDPGTAGERSSLDTISERVAWWAELFEIPCVGFAGSLDEVEPLAAAGADFVAVGDCVFTDRRGCRVAVAEAARRLDIAETPA
jgi:thiamine-phosphate pyrophosphorylase